ncbi:prephenate dehydratase [Pectinatus haikarae]|uniref:Prephenate dehydratase n=1 Tax=Pectinatus haikarae TaxID=349096 RepID=A0ABT9YAD5_9FIRM|nr:prephenate dehydratase [Pectinatus haikarae]MDQ0204805.1 prephenate dehydratase [Pectinatus haikarae]
MFLGGVGRIMSVLGFLGPNGTHSEEAAIYMNTLLGNNWVLKPYRSIYEAIAAADEGEADCCFVPVENSIEGSVRITLDTLAHDVDLKINMELVWAVHNQLLVKDSREKITKLISHPQALAQCRKYIKMNYSAAELVEVSSTAHAAEVVAAGMKNAAAIASKRSADIYNLTVLDKDIQDNCDNVTRFILLSKTTSSINKTDPEKTMLICQMDGSKAGSLCDVLAEFAKYNINMTHIESRPTRMQLGRYMFFFEVEVPLDGRERLIKAIAAVKKKCFWLKDMGLFPVIKAENKKWR